MQEGCLEWRGPRYVEFQAPRPAMVDVETMKMSYLTGPDDHARYAFSPDFRRAVRTDEHGALSIGRVQLPPP